MAGTSILNAKFIISLFLGLPLIISALPACGKDSTESIVESCREFVQDFYDWYTPIANSTENKEPSSDIAIREKAFYFILNSFKH